MKNNQSSLEITEQSTEIMEGSESHKKFLDDSIGQLTSKETASEVECKIFDNASSEQERKKNTQDIQNKIVFSGGEVIFNGIIKDTRYLDTKDYSNSYLKNHNISMVRLREQTNKGDTEYMYVIKSIDENNNNKEYEVIKDKDFAKNILEEKYGLIEIKKSEKKRIEYQLEFGEESSESEGKQRKCYKVKIAFDEYTDNLNKKIPPFFEIESDSQEGVNLAIKKLKLDKGNYKITQAGPKKILKELDTENDRKMIEGLEITNKTIKRFKEKILSLLSESIYVSVGEFLSNCKQEVVEGENKKELNAFLKRFLINQIKNLINSEEKYKYVLSRLIEYSYGTKEEIKMGKKFSDKFTRESTGYIRALTLSILDCYKNNDIVGEVTDVQKFSAIVKQKLGGFMTAMMLFDDTLTKNELQKFLSQSEEEISGRYSDIDKDVKDFYNFIDNNPSLPGGLLDSTNGKEILHSIFLVYRRSVAKTAFEGVNDEMKTAANVLSENIQIYIGELFKNLAEDFSVWLNNPNKKETTFTKIRENVKEILFFVYVFKNKKKAFSNIVPDKFSQELMSSCKTLFEKSLFDKNTFIDPEHDMKMFNIFLDNIFDNTGNDKGGMIGIKEQYEIFHKQEIVKLLDNSLNDHGNSDNLECYSTRLNKGDVKPEEVTHHLWNTLNSDLVLKTFMTVVLEKTGREDGYVLNKNVCHIDKNTEDGSKLFDAFLLYHYKIKNPDTFEIHDGDLMEDSDFIQYNADTSIQFDETIKKLSTMNNDNYTSMYDFIEDDINSFHLLVAWNRFNLKCKQIDTGNVNTKSISGYDIKSQNFSESVVRKLQDKGKLVVGDDNILENKLGAKLRVTTSDAYNSAIWDEEYIEKKFRRIINGKSVDLSTSYSYEELGKTTFFHKITGLYIPLLEEGDDVDNLEKISAYIDRGLNVVRALLDEEEPSENDYLFFLKGLGFPLKSEKHLNKLLEFLRFLKSFTFKSVPKIYNNGVEDTAFCRGLLEKDDFLTKTGLKDNEVIIAPVKAQSGIFRKGVYKQGGRFEKVGDPARMTLKKDSLEELATVAANFIEYVGEMDEVDEIWFEDKIGNMFQKADKPNGYRDGKIILVLGDGNTIEVQLQLAGYLHVKHDGLDEQELEKIQGLLNERDDLIFSTVEQEEIVRFSVLTGIGLSLDFCKMFLSGVNYENVISEGQNFSADFTYRISRLSDNVEINKKIDEIDRILFDFMAAGKVVRKEIERIMTDKI